MRILIVKLSAIGDVVQCLPAVKALRDSCPDSEITWVVGDAAADILRGNPLIDHLIVFPRRAWGQGLARPRSWPRLVDEVLSFFSRLRGRSYDIAIDFQGLLKSGLVTWLSRSKRKIGFSGQREGSSLFLNDKLPPYDPDEHAVLRYLRLARHAGANTGNFPGFTIWFSSQDKNDVDRLLSDLGLVQDKILCLIPGTRWKTKLWTPEGFAKVADICQDRWGLSPVVVGGPGDRDLARAIKDKAKTLVTDLTGKTTLRALAALFGRSKVVVTTDTGPMHLAAAVGVPVVALFGPTAPWRTGPFGKVHQVVRIGLECSPCFNRSCSDPRCMSQITPQMVMERVEKILCQ